MTGAVAVGSVRLRVEPASLLADGLLLPRLCTAQVEPVVALLLTDDPIAALRGNRADRGRRGVQRAQSNRRAAAKARGDREGEQALKSRRHWVASSFAESSEGRGRLRGKVE